MLLKDKIAVIYGGGGAIGGATARAFAREGAEIFLAGRTLERLERVAADIRAEGGRASVDVVDAQDQDAVDAHAGRVAKRAGGIDIALNAVSVVHTQGLPMADVGVDQFLHVINANARTNYVTAKAVAPHMAERGGGVILTLTAPGSRITSPGFLGHGVACSAVETFSRLLAVELGHRGIRVICLRSDAIPDAVPLSYTQGLFDDMTRRFGTTTEAWLETHAKQDTLLGRLPRLDQVADYAAFVASDRAGAMTGALANLTCGSVLD
ncbi:SDR family NAD(P)-dependent oxidoreductase [Kaistia nematophila]|uniref:SDR family oxidoreductase n=1 Tax=Kaistia nematophila TaxID=2994654 RepID=A0A9X3IIK9_9HYPH|nr:SDR family oxidoreductase [Kaistia nematophila]MCX5567604.1 SDR family oxidoreductase [Kaistia nematophila]